MTAGSLVLANAEAKNPIIIGAPSTKETTVSGLSSDGKIRVEITASNPVAGETMSIDVKFRDSNGGGLKKYVNYAIAATQNNNQVLSVTEAYEQEGSGIHKTIPLPSDKPVEIQVTLLGFGVHDDKANWTGPTGEILMFSVVPEFGTITILILAIAIISTTMISAKSKLGIRSKL